MLSRGVAERVNNGKIWVAVIVWCSTTSQKNCAALLGGCRVRAIAMFYFASCYITPRLGFADNPAHRWNRAVPCPSVLRRVIHESKGGRYSFWLRGIAASSVIRSKRRSPLTKRYMCRYKSWDKRRERCHFLSLSSICLAAFRSKPRQNRRIWS